MRKGMILFILLLLICSYLKAQNILVANVNVISMKDGTIVYKRSVLILDGKIASVKDVIKVDPKNKVVVIDGGGAYMMPGLFDMHMHFYHDLDSTKNISTKRWSSVGEWRYHRKNYEWNVPSILS